MGIAIRSLATIAVLAGLTGLTGCGAAAEASWRGPGGEAGSGGAQIAIKAPADGATDVPTAGEIALSGAAPATAASTAASSTAASATASSAASAIVSVTDSTGAAVEGALRPDGSAWVPAEQLKYRTTYTATLAGAGKAGAKRVTFTTMDRPANLVRISTPLDDDQVYGVGMPIVVRFDRAVPAGARADVERRLFVDSQPPQVGAWHWFSGDEVHFRPREYWQEGTKLSVRLAVGGLPLGGNAYGSGDVTIRATIGEKIMMTIDDATKSLTVTRQDQVVRTIPVSLGKPSTPTSSGAMVVMTKNESELFVSTTPGDSYRETVYWTQRLTTGGEYVHAAPWSVADQGKRNVSHGCTNVSTENAKWLFGLTHVGDPVLVKGTTRQVEWGNGWTDWDRPWEEYRKGSALPAPPAG